MITGTVAVNHQEWAVSLHPNRERFNINVTGGDLGGGMGVAAVSKIDNGTRVPHTISNGASGEEFYFSSKKSQQCQQSLLIRISGINSAVDYLKR